MHFSRLRLSGFKSFVDATDLDIGEGMTGIVGPNGCGKSNLVEALRWVMGETSPKRMRGAGMEDVIFAGTATRPPRNLAEVSLTLENEDRTATAEYNDADELTVIRKIERGAGSDYKINSKPVRQKDIQLLFADQSTGAQSTSVVGQGQIDALIRAKPQDRRRILEEASGTAGLQTRRHEAELKLRAAEKNLTRVDDVLGALDTQLRSLKQQVRQASRYRNLADHIRRTEAALLHLRWLEAEQDSEKVTESLKEAEQKVTELMSVVTRGETQRTDTASELPALRQAEAAAAAVVQKLTLAREQIDQEAARIQGQIDATESRLTQAQNDQEREQTRHKDGQEALARLSAEKQELRERKTEISEKLPGLNEVLEAMTGEVQELETALSSLMEEAAHTEARQSALVREMEALKNRRATLNTRRDELSTQRAALAEEIAMRPDLSLAREMVTACEKELSKRKDQAAEAEQAKDQAEETLGAAREKAQEASTSLTKLHAESEAITALLAHDDDETDQVIDLITVTPGLEKALAVALGEALTAALDNNASMHWREMAPLANAAALPAGTKSLADYVEAPKALARSLSQIGLVEDKAQGEAACEALQAGQILVSRDGWAWRWDGFTLSPEAKTSSAMRLQQRNKLAALEEKIETARTEKETTEAALLEATSLFKQCQALDHQTREALGLAFAALSEARENFANQEKEAAAANAKLTSFDENLAQLAGDIEAVVARGTSIEEEQKELPNIDELRENISEKRTLLAEARGRLASQESEEQRLSHELQQCERRETTIDQEMEAWISRMESAEAQTKDLAGRIELMTKELKELRAKPEELETRRSSLMNELEEAESKRNKAADELIEREQKLSVTEHQLKQDEGALAAAREERVRIQAAIEACGEHFNSLRERMEEKLECEPDDLREIADLKEGEELPNLYELEQKMAKFIRERENMGPVNLRAEMESQTTQEEIEKLTNEKDDLVAAIAKLRQGIGQLNREARQRLNEAFTQVNERFQNLFTGLFGGGRAYLELIDNEDPMNAGLEIIAAPPGKKQQILSLLSGGERTLTALALLFAVFQTNPSPICVLDEAEAALDESNIGRFCELVSRIAREVGTRFLIITHQRLTMAHMDRLFGVTMSEKGVSKLVSVDLQSAVALRDGKKIGGGDVKTTAEETAAENAEESLKDVQAA